MKTIAPLLFGFLTIAAQGDQSFTQAQVSAGSSCVQWQQSVGPNAADSVNTVQAYRYVVTLDGLVTSAIVTCADSATHSSPYTCQIPIPVAGQSVGKHTLTVQAIDANGQMNIATSYSYSVTAVIGPPPSPVNLHIVVQ